MIRSEAGGRPSCVEVGEPGGDARELAVALVGLGRHVDGRRERIGEFLEAAVVLAGFGEFVEAPLGRLDLVAGPGLDRRLVGAVDHVLADGDEAAADGQIVDGAAVLARIDDGGGFRREAGEVLHRRDAAEIDVAEIGLERDRRGELAGLDQRDRDFKNLAVDRLHEVLGQQEVRDAVIGVVVDHDRAEERLLRVDVVRRHPVLGLDRFELGREGVGQGHGVSRSVAAAATGRPFPCPPDLAPGW